MAKGLANNGKLEENETLMSNGRTKPPEKTGFGAFIYNKEKGTCLGRTANSWFKITVFYIIFYAFLAAFWIACLAVFLKTVDSELPRFYGKGTIIGANPGVGFFPMVEGGSGINAHQVRPQRPVLLLAIHGCHEQVL